MLEDRLRRALEGIRKALIIREKIMLSFLEALAEIELRNEVVLQGGNALHFGYGSPRYSKDLDFVLREGDVNSEEFEELCYKLSKVLVKFENYPTEVNVKKLQDRLYRIKIKVHFEEQKTKALFKDPLTVKLDVYNIMSHSPDEISIGKGFILIEKPIEIFADKIVADIERLRDRGSLKLYDLFDWYFILTNFDINIEEVAELIIRKVEEYNMNQLKESDFDSLITYLDNKKNLETFYEVMMGYIPKQEFQRLKSIHGFTNLIKENLIKLKNIVLKR
ncbi:hypothetical protein DRJ19_01725 [Candidatus Woesearchaeota archaeon]|nr:MAG: hypothetical protein DRJ19_01725 [Candidatus Woesearchaeota archaeon]